MSVVLLQLRMTSISSLGLSGARAADSVTPTKHGQEPVCAH